MNYNGLTPEEVLAIATKKISGLKSIVSYKGVTTTALTDGSTTNPIIIEGSSYTATNGDCVLYEGVYYTWNGTLWQESLSFAEVITALENLNDRVDDTEDALDTKVDKVDGKGLSTNDYTDEDKAIVDGVTDALAEKADTDDILDLVSDNLAKGILGNETVLSTDTVPFVSKTMSVGKYQRKKFVGCSFVWNQLVDSNTESVTIASGHKYAFYQNGAWSIGASDGTAIAVTGGSDLFTDLTQLFGSTTIADYIYNLETATAGAGVAKLKELGFFTEDYYAYDAGSIQSVDIKEYSVLGDSTNLFGGKAMIKNALSVHGENVIINETDDTVILRATLMKTGYVITTFDKWALPNTQYTFMLTYSNHVNETNLGLVYTDGTLFNIPRVPTSEYESGEHVTTIFTSAPNKTISYLRGIWNNGISTLYADESGIFAKDTTEFEPYHKTTYPLTPTELRGVPKIDANNNIYADGDEYASDGGHTENYGIVNLGELTWTYTQPEEGYTPFGYFSASHNKNNIPAIAQTTPQNGINAKGYTNVGRYYITNRSDRKDMSIAWDTTYVRITNSSYTDATEFKASLSGTYLVYEKATPTTETLTPFDYPQSVGSLEEIVDYKVEQEDRDVAIPTGHVTEYMGKGGEFTLPTLPETPSVLAFDGHNFFWKPETT